ncbi:MAG: hypothetical protein ACI9MR_000544 [Myxococcota bacterium]|jgi:hypothetical protein
MSAKTKASTLRSRRRKRERWGSERPLEATGSVRHVAEVAVEPSRSARFMAAIVAALPAYEASSAGRGRANGVRLAIGAVAVVLVTQAKDSIALGVLGALVGLTALIIPMPELRKRRWLEGTGQGRTKLETRMMPARLHWNGQKLSVRSNDGVRDWRGWRSLRPRQTASRVAIGTLDGRALLGLVPEHGKRDTAIWFETAASNVVDTFDPFEPTAAFGEGPETETIAVNGETFADLLEAFWDQTAKGIPRPLNAPPVNSAAAKKKRR